MRDGKDKKMRGRKGRSSWRLYKNAWIFLEESEENLLSKEEARSILKGKGLMIRNTYDFDTKEETSFWFVIKDKLEDISELPFSARRNIRISERKYDFKRCEKELFINIAHPILIARQKSLKNKTMSENDFRIMIEEYEKNCKIDYWIVNEKDKEECVAFSINRIKENSCEYDFMSCKPEALHNRTHPYYGLIFSMNQYYLGEKKVKYVCDGSRTITEHSNIQDYLIHNFKFRKAYCKLKIHYKWWFGIVIKMLFPFRNLIPVRNIRAILKMEEYSRNI